MFSFHLEISAGWGWVVFLLIAMVIAAHEVDLIKMAVDAVLPLTQW